MDKQKILLAGKIASQIREFARKNIKKGMKLIDIADLIEDKMSEINPDAKPAFPTCLSVDFIAAHATPAHDDERIAKGILKVDMGVHLDGWIADTAFSIDLENKEENKKIILASENALKAAIKTIKNKVEIREIGKAIHKEISSLGLNPITNLGGHGINQYDLHSRVWIPNTDNKDKEKIVPGLYAIEPFATSGIGKVHDGNPSGIYKLKTEKNIRSPIAREVLNFIKKEYQTLPFCSRWLVKKFGTKALFGLKQLEEQNVLHSYAELVENSKSLVAQTEHTILVEEDKVIVTTL